MKTTSLAVAAAVLLVGCATNPAQPDPAPEPTATAISTTPEVRARPSTAAAFVDPRVPVPCDVDRELTDIEKDFLVEPGAFADDFDAEAVVALNPTTAEEWAIAIRSMVQGDHAEAVCEMIRFELDLGESAATPGDVAGKTAPSRRSHYAIVLDASGSMAARSGSTRMQEAKAAIAEFASELPEGSTVSLRIYGHEGNNQESGRVASCGSSERIYEGPAGDAGLAAALDGVDAVGWTPLGKAIGDAAADVPADATEAIVYVVSDGLETCGGDPVQAARDVAAGGIQPVINVIGFEVGADERAALESVADAGGGTYVHASNSEEFRIFWTAERRELFHEWAAWRDAEWDRLRQIRDEEIFPLLSVPRGLQTATHQESRKASTIADRLKDEGAVDVQTRAALGSALYRQFDQRLALLYDNSQRLRDAFSAYSEAFWEAFEATPDMWELDEDG